MLSDGTAIATMPGKGKDLRPKSGKDAPGPGAYDPKVNYSRKSDPNFSMSKTTRDAALGLYTQTPAPGTYFVSDGLEGLTQQVGGSGLRVDQSSSSTVPPTPGPGTYNQKSTINGPQFHMGSKYDAIGDSFPGPGSYQPAHQAKMKRAPSFSDGQLEQSDAEVAQRQSGTGDLQLREEPRKQEWP
eukprot:CAMPEP_0202965468 /NCGR_PEP_ID=MMETSP1396-20130829/9434_1 /ASSEMBLY_ACC=CAM_ASM_000872 /TAXON_ID= /ORGANISM="Pseudokeronopsis sp., Strain Brazil" /LENGTH=184 /DNA_ID=CAMNT_0049688195 /DNA_START=609 /DNA_END=1162 /DNA_ORIENTATION=-